VLPHSLGWIVVMLWTMLVAVGFAGSFSVEGTLVHRYQLAQGALDTGKVNLRNTSTEGTTVGAKLIDFVDTDQGVATYGGGTLKRSAAAWVTIAQPLVEVPESSQAPVEWTVRVPDGAPPGSYWAAIELTPSAIESASTVGRRSVGIAVVQQYSISLFVEVPGGKTSLSFGAKSLEQTQKGAVLHASLVNDGDYRLRPKLYVDVYDDRGVERSHLEGKDLWIYPDTTRDYSLPLENLPPGKYSLLIVADDKRLDPIGAQYTIELR